MRATGLMLALAACAPVGATPSTPTTPGSTPTSGTPPVTPTGPVAVEDWFAQDLHPSVDVLFVVQDTAGMTDVQHTLAENSPRFFEYFLGSGIDYRVGVVTTDLDGPRPGWLRTIGGIRWIDADQPNPVELFSEMIEPGDASVAVPQPLGAVYATLETERDLANAGFYRDDATLEVILVGDGDDATDPVNLDPAGFTAWFDALKAAPADASLSCVVLDGSPATACADNAAAVGGLVLGSGDPYAMESLGVRSAGLFQSYPLSMVPDPTTLEVVVEDPSGASLRFLEEDWGYDAITNAVTFVEYVPSAGSEVVITYVAAP